MRLSMTLVCGVLIALAAATMIAGGASAATVWYEDSYGFEQTDWQHVLSVQQFDPTLGTLQSALVEMSGQVCGSIYLNNKSTFTISTGTGTLRAAISVAGPGALLGPVNPTASLTATLGPGQSTTDNTKLSDVLTTSAMVSAGSLSNYIGTGSVDFLASALGTSYGNGLQNWEYIFQTNGKADVRVTYTYEAVPEFSSLLLAMGGLGSVSGLIRLRRR